MWSTFYLENLAGTMATPLTACRFLPLITRDLTCPSLQFILISPSRPQFSPFYLFLFSRAIVVTTTTNFRYTDVSTSKKIGTLPLVTNKYIQARSLHPDYYINNHAQTGMSFRNTIVTTSSTRNYKNDIFSNSAKHALRSVDTTLKPITCRLAQPFHPIAHWSKHSSVPHLCIDASNPLLKLDCKLLGYVATISRFHSLQILKNIKFAIYALWLSAPQLVCRERYSSVISASKPGKFASHASRTLVCDVSIKDLVIPQGMRRYTTAVQKHELKLKI